MLIASDQIRTSSFEGDGLLKVLLLEPDGKIREGTSSFAGDGLLKGAICVDERRGERRYVLLCGGRVVEGAHPGAV